MGSEIWSIFLNLWELYDLIIDLEFDDGFKLVFMK